MIEKNQELGDAKKRLAATKYVLALAFCAWPLGLFFDLETCFFIFAPLIALWGVSTYIAYMHYQTIRNRLK